MHITHFGCTNLPPLGRMRLDFDNRVNLFVGPNASGKSSLLRAIAAVHSSGRSYTQDGAVHAYMEASEDWPRENADDVESVVWSTVPFTYIPATRVHLPGRHVFAPAVKAADDTESEEPATDLSENRSDIFDGVTVEKFISLYRNLVSMNPSEQREFRRGIQLGYSCSKTICAEVIHDDVPHPYVEFDDDKEFEDERRIDRYGMGIVTTDNILGDPLYTGVLSSGTQGTLLWIWELSLRMVTHGRLRPGWQDEPAILLIDEIENHLHPTWQRRVIPALLKHFPGLQIFATTHSPFVVAGIKAGQVHLLKRDQEGKVTATPNPEDIVGWTADEILRTMMGVDDPTDDETAAAARELRQLRSEGPLEDETAEAQRQAQIQELRKKVNRDLLACGPMAAQRQLFEEQFAKSLEEYRRSRDLNQENS